jgi:hypothetical protein
VPGQTQRRCTQCNEAKPLASFYSATGQQCGGESARADYLDWSPAPQSL